MRDSCFPIAAAVLGVCIVLGVGIFLFPSFNDRISWRLDGAMTYVRAVFSPAGELPTPVDPGPELAEPQATPLASPDAALKTPPADEPTTPEPTALPTPFPTPLPKSALLPPPKWEKQDWNNCGPAALAMYLRFYGWEGTQLDISKELKPAREDRNVNVEELAYFTRTHAGWLDVQYRVGGNVDLLKELLANGFPVMLEESFKFDSGYWPNDDLWGAHYQLLTGYDDNEGVFVGQDTYYGANQKVTFATLDDNWHAFNRVFILLFPQDQAETIKTILGPDWDEEQNRQRALDASEKDTRQHPQDAYAWFNKGTNLVYFERYGEAARAYDEARRIGLPQRMLRYQFGPFIAYFHAGRTDDLDALTDYALKRTANSEEALLWKGWGLYRKGDKKEARVYFQSALDANADYQDARYALDFLDQE